METLMKCRVLLITPTFSAPCRRIFYKAGLNYTKWKKPRELELDRNLVWAKYCGLKIAQVNYKRLLFEEFMHECQIDHENDNENILTLHSRIGILIKKNLVESCESVIDQLLSQVEPFPFDRSQILEKYQDENDLSIRLIRNEIERQYLAYKYNVDVTCVREILNRFGLGLYDYRSLKNMQRNVEKLEQWPGAHKLSVADKIYYINQIPFSLKHIKTHQKVTSMLKMKLFPAENSKLFSHSHECILLLVSTLLDKNFRMKQIEEALPFLHISFSSILKKLNFLLTTPKIAKHRDEDKFLILLICSKKELREQAVLPNSSFESLLDVAENSINEGIHFRKRTSIYTILYLVNQFFTVQSNILNTLRKYSKFSLVPEKQLLDTLAFLKGLKISDEELEESLTIILYPRNRISRVFKKIKSEEKSLDKYGFVKGCLPEETNLFKSGTKQKRKILQLCLYFLEKQFNFPGEGTWQMETERKLS